MLAGVVVAVRKMSLGERALGGAVDTVVDRSNHELLMVEGVVASGVPPEGGVDDSGGIGGR